MTTKKLNEKQIIQLWELCKKVKMVGVPTKGNDEDIRMNVFERCLTVANQKFLLKAGTGDAFERAAKRVLRSSLADELKTLATKQRAFENDMISFSALELESKNGEMDVFEPVDPKSTAKNYSPIQATEWELEVEAFRKEVQLKLRELPSDLRKYAKGLMQGIPSVRLAARLGKGRTTLFRMRQELQIAFSALYQKWRKLHNELG